MAQKIPMHFSTWEKENKEMKYTVDTLQLFSIYFVYTVYIKSVFTPRTLGKKDGKNMVQILVIIWA